MSKVTSANRINIALARAAVKRPERSVLSPRRIRRRRCDDIQTIRFKRI